MNFLHRLKYYLFGVGLGILLVLAIFKDRKLTSWTPENQVKKDLAGNQLVLDEYASCILNCLEVDKESFQKSLANGDVDFSKSEVHGENKIYYVIPESTVFTSVMVEFSDKNLIVNDIAVTRQCPCRK